MRITGTDDQAVINYKSHRFPLKINSHAVWLYHRFNLNLHEVEEMLLKRGINVSYETVVNGGVTNGQRGGAKVGLSANLSV